MIEPARHHTPPGNKLSVGGRVMAGAIACACLTVLCVAAWLTPEARGLGTHRQLGMPACGWMTFLGRPCITCGMTTSFAYAVRGNFVGSFQAQPSGFVMALGTAVAFWPALWGAVSGARVDRFAMAMLRPRVLWIAAFGLMMAWVYKLMTFRDML